MWATDTMYGRVNLLDGNLYAQVFSNRTYFSEIYPMSKKADARQALNTFVTELGVPEELIVNGSKNHNSPGTEFMKCFWMNSISLTRTDSYRPNHNP